MAHKNKLMATAALALVAGLSMGTPAAACEAEGRTAAQIRACEDRWAETKAAEEAAEKARSDRYADFEQDAANARVAQAEMDRRAAVEAWLSANEAEWKRKDRAAIVAENNELIALSQAPWNAGVNINGRIVRNVDGFVDSRWLAIKHNQAPWLFDPDYPGPGTWVDDPEGGGTGTGGGTDTGGGTTDPDPDTGTGGGTDTGGGTTDPDPETPIDPEDGTDGTDGTDGSDGTDGDSPRRVALPPFPAEDAVWRCSNFRVLTAAEDAALQGIEGEVFFSGNSLRLRGRDGVERTLPVQYVIDEEGETLIVWPYLNADLDEACPE
jgi:hypothetical protein